MKYEELSKIHTIVDFSDEEGVYFGDPCYVYPDERWESFCDANFAYEREHNPDRHHIGKITEDSGKVWYGWSTAYGDGCYALQRSGVTVARLGVDAGMLSAIPMSLIKEWGAEASARELGHVLEPDHCVGPLNVDRGDMSWGNGGYEITLPTGDSIYEDEDEYDECEPNWY